MLISTSTLIVPCPVIHITKEYKTMLKYSFTYIYKILVIHISSNLNFIYIFCMNHCFRSSHLIFISWINLNLELYKCLYCCPDMSSLIHINASIINIISHSVFSGPLITSELVFTNLPSKSVKYLYLYGLMEIICYHKH